MPQRIALLLTVVFVVLLFRRDFREKPNVTRALWIPLLWMLIIGSRFVSQWLGVWGLPLGTSSLEEGSPLDALVFLTLIVAGIVVLKRRHVTVSNIMRNNGWLALFFIYCFVSILWSDFPFVAIKRWIKIVGHPVMALILLTEPDPETAVIRLMRRAAYVLLPFSVLFIKYYPEYGRGFDTWTGAAANTGVTADKNALGYLCMVFGFCFTWQLLKLLRTDKGPKRRNELLLIAGFLFMIGWLLSLANAKTALVTLVVSVFTMVLLGFRWVNKRYIGAYIVAGVLVFGTAETLLDVYANVIKMLGRDPTLTDRTKVWADVLELANDPILGTGFESFWLGERLDKLWAKWWWQPNQAHNGYIETYLNLGLVGVFILLGLFVATFRKIRRELLRDLDWGRFRLCLFFAILLFNYTDAVFKALHPLWFVFYIIAMDYPKPRVEQWTGGSEADHAEHEPQFASA